MKLSISTFKIICYFWNYPNEILEDKDYLEATIRQLNTTSYFTGKDREIAVKEINKLIKTL